MRKFVLFAVMAASLAGPAGDPAAPDRQSAELATAARRGNPGAVSEIPLEFIDDTLGFHPEWIVDKIR